MNTQDILDQIQEAAENLRLVVEAKKDDDVEDKSDDKDVEDKSDKDVDAKDDKSDKDDTEIKDVDDEDDSDDEDEDDEKNESTSRFEAWGTQGRNETAWRRSFDSKAEMDAWLKNKEKQADHYLSGTRALKESTEKNEAVAPKQKSKGFEAHGVKGMKSTPWRKKFKSEEEFNKWMDKNEDDYEVHGTRDLDESADVFESIFDGLELSEEFKEKAITAIEMVVESRAMKLVKEFKAAKQELVESAEIEATDHKERIVDKIDGYLSHLSEEWMENNTIAVDTGIQAQLFESLIRDFGGILKKHSVSTDVFETSVMEESAQEVEALRGKLDEATVALDKANKRLGKIEREIQLAEACEGLSEMEAERLTKLASDIGSNRFGEKLEMIRESITESRTQKTLNESILDTGATVDKAAAEKYKGADPFVASLASRIKPK